VLTAGDHALVKKRVRETRNYLARERRRAPVTVVRVQDGKTTLLIAVSRTTPTIGYLLRPDADGRLTCQCRGYSIRGRCAHVEAAG
jgi:hypothetical protein